MTATTIQHETRYTPHTAGALAPVDPRERSVTLDVLRGFAMFGVLWSNLNDWYGTRAPSTPLDQVFSWAQNWLVSSRFYTLLAFLFGVGFAMQLLRAESRGQDVRAAYVRRLLVLLAIGLAHGFFVWRGDILALYATMGFALLLFRRLSPRGLLVAAIVIFWITPAVRAAILVHFHLVQVPAVNYSVAEYVYANGTFAQIFEMRIRDFADKFSRTIMFPWPGFLALFVLGMWVGRIGLVQNLKQRLPQIRRALVVTLVLCGVGLFIQHNFSDWWPRTSGQAGSLREFLARIPRGQTSLIVYSLGLWSMAAVYACALTLLVHRSGWSRRLAPLAAVGRMPLTTYLTQSVVCSTLFYGYGLGWFGKVGFTGMFVITIVLFSLQMLASTWWLRRYRFGPVEWLWRSLSYGAAQPMRV